MNIRLACLLLIGYLCLHAVASASVIHIGQRDTVYLNDTVDLRGITGWADTLAWWSSNQDPSQDPPDAFINITRYENYTIPMDLQSGWWYQWYGFNEKSPVPVFWVVPRIRPIQNTTQPVVNYPAPPVVPKRIQPPDIADLVMANGDNVSFPTAGPCQAWMVGPGIVIAGELVGGTINLSAMQLSPGTYSLLFQYPDLMGTYEVYANPDTQTVDSVWKGVDGFWYAPLAGDVFLEKLNGMFSDPNYFHGNVTTRKVIAEDQHVDVNNLFQTTDGSVFIEGITNLAQGDNITLVWDADKHAVEYYRLRNYTYYSTAMGSDPGAYRIWQATMNVNLSSQTIGNHHITVTTPDGHTTTVQFYVQSAFQSAPPPLANIQYVNNSPFLPQPTPIVITQQVPVTVVQVVTVAVTPAYDTILQAQVEAQRQVADEQTAAWITDAITGAFLLALAIVGYKSIRYLQGVAKRARAVP